MPISFIQLRRGGARLLAIVVLLGSVLAGLAAPLAVHAAGTTVSLKPESISVKPGDQFTVDVVINTDVGSRAMTNTLTFDPKVVQVDKIDEGSFYKDWAAANKMSTLVFPEPGIDNANGTVSSVGVTIMGRYEGGPTNSGTVVTYHLTAKQEASGSSPLTLGSVIVANDQIGDKAKAISNVTVKNGQVAVSGVAAPVAVGAPAGAIAATPATALTPAVAGQSAQGGVVIQPTAAPTSAAAQPTAAKAAVASAGQSTTSEKQKAERVAAETKDSSSLSPELVSGIVGALVVGSIVGYTAFRTLRQIEPARESAELDESKPVQANQPRRRRTGAGANG